VPGEQNQDPDGDTLDNLTEQGLGTNPLVADTDGDGLDDNQETNTGVYVSPSDTGSDPLVVDTDGDGTPDGLEVAQGWDPTDPNNPGTFSVPTLGWPGLTLLAAVLFALGSQVLNGPRVGRRRSSI